MVTERNTDFSKMVKLNKDANQERIIDQYKIIIDSINKINEVRESSNNFWVTVNSLGISAIAYISDNKGFGGNQKPLIIWVLILLGFILCLSWLSYLRTIKHSIDHRHSLLVIMEKYLPIPIFQIFLEESGRKANKYSLTIREMFVPISFFLGYIFFSILMIFFDTKFSNPQK